jgi:hypothetical protein
VLGIFGEIWSKLLDDIFGIAGFILTFGDVAGGWSGGHSGSLMGFLDYVFLFVGGKRGRFGGEQRNISGRVG